MESLTKSMVCPCCEKQISFQNRYPIFLQCKHFFCKDCLETQKTQTEDIENFINVTCYVCK